MLYHQVDCHSVLIIGILYICCSPKKQLHLDIVRSKSFLVFHDLSSEDEAKVFHRSSGKLSRNGFLELEKADLRKAKNKPEDNDETFIRTMVPRLKF